MIVRMERAIVSVHLVHAQAIQSISTVSPKDNICKKDEDSHKAHKSPQKICPQRLVKWHPGRECLLKSRGQLSDDVTRGSHSSTRVGLGHRGVQGLGSEGREGGDGI